MAGSTNEEVISCTKLNTGLAASGPVALGHNYGMPSLDNLMWLSVGSNTCKLGLCFKVIHEVKINITKTRMQASSKIHGWVVAKKVSTKKKGH